MAGKSKMHLGPKLRTIPNELAHHFSHGLGAAINPTKGRHNTAHAYNDRERGLLRTTRGFASSKTQLPAVDIQPRHGRGKFSTAVAVHSGMKTTTRHDGVMRVGGGDMASALSSGSVGPALGDMLSPTPKAFPDPAPAFGQRSRTNTDIEGRKPGENFHINRGRGLDHDLGRAILDQAAGPHPNGLSRIPQTVKSK